jgi:hypothetical protein
VTSVNGQTGTIVLTTDNVSENGGLLYSTSRRIRQSFSFGGATGTFNSEDGVLAVNSRIYSYPKISGISVSSFSYLTTLPDRAVASGGYVIINGSGFAPGAQVYIGSIAAASVIYYSDKQLNVQLPTIGNGVYTVYMVAADGAVAIRINGVTVSDTPTWSTNTTLPTTGTDSAISIQLGATSDSSVTFQLQSDSSLPPGITLTTGGLLSGTVVGLTATVVYSFTIVTIDAESQTAARSFTITVTGRDQFFANTSLLLKTTESSLVRSTITADSSAVPLTVTRVGTPTTNLAGPYQTAGYWSNYFVASAALFNASVSNMSFGSSTNNFTIEAYINWPSLATGNQTFFELTGTTRMILGRSTTGIRIFWNGTERGAIYTFTPGIWYHIAIVRNSGTVSCYINGVSAITTFTETVTWASTRFNIGMNSDTAEPMTGYISNLRVVNGTAVYTANFAPPTAPLTATQSAGTNIAAVTGTATALLTCQSNRFQDNSSNNFTITTSGTPRVQYDIQPFTAPAPSFGAALLNGTTDYFLVPDNTSVNMGAADFTIECWYYPTTTTPSGSIVSKRATTAIYGGVILGFASSLAPVILATVDGTTWGFNVTSSIACAINSWNHIVYLRNGTAWRLYVNGVLGTTATLAGTVPTNAAALSIAASAADGGSPLSAGYISNFRLVKGTVVYTGAFTPPNGPLTQTGGTYPSTANVNTSIPSANTVLLLDFIDSNYSSVSTAAQNTLFVDRSANQFNITRSGNPSQGSFTPYWPDRYWSNYFNGSSDYLTATTTPLNSILNVTTGQDGTLECWVYPIQLKTGSQGYYASCIIAKGTIYTALLIDAAGIVSWYVYTGSLNYVSTGAGVVTNNAWQHIALVWTNGNLKIYVNGTQQASGTRYSPQSNNELFKIGASDFAQSTGFWFGYISNLRIVSRAVYTGNFTPSTAPLNPINGTLLLTCQSHRFRDNSVNALPITVGNTPRSQPATPFLTTSAYNPLTMGGSGYFNGSTDYLTVTGNSVFDFGSGNFTIEAWLYFTNAGANALQTIYSNYTSFAPAGSIFFGKHSVYSGRVSVYFSSYSTGGALLVEPALPPNNAWTHYALVRNGNTFTLYQNGVATTTSTAFTGVATAATPPQYVGCAGDAINTYNFPGYMSNFRIVKGVAVYTGSFSPPALAPLTPMGSTSSGSYPSVTNVNTTFSLLNTSLLLSFTNSAVYDATGQSNILTVGDAKTNNTVNQWAPSSMRFDGSGDYLAFPSSPAFGLGNGNFTIELWVRPITQGGHGSGNNDCLLDFRPAGQGAYGTLYLFNNGAGLYWYVSSANRITGGPISNNVWSYVAVVRSSGNTRLYINGVQTGSTFADSTNYLTSPLWIGQFNDGAGSGFFDGYIQDLRITQGVARTVTALPIGAFIDYGGASVAYSVPESPTVGTVTQLSSTSVSVPFTAPLFNGNIAITSYTAISTPGNISGTVAQSGSGTITVTGLSSGTTYSFQVYATNSIGNSANSAASSTLTLINILFTMEYLVVAGGAGGGGRSGGGGGAGGMLLSTSTISPNSFNVTVGGGGNGGPGTGGGGQPGNGSSFGSIAVAVGGGGGGGDGQNAGAAGGSGGGGRYGAYGGAGTSGQGNNGGYGTESTWKGGGGGGADGVGVDGVATPHKCGNGGSGKISTIDGTNTYYAGGGGGGSHNASAGGFGPQDASARGIGGLGGGGNGGIPGGRNPGDAGQANTGGGGGAGSTTNDPGGSGGTGGSGIVMIAYPSTGVNLTSISAGLVTQSWNGSAWVNNAAGVTTPVTNLRSGYKIYRFVSGTGTIQW